MPTRPARLAAVTLLLLAAAACAPTTAATPPAATAASAGAPALFPGAGTAAAIPSPIAFVSLEGPLWVAKGSYLLFSDVVEKNAPGAVIYRFDPGPRRFSVFPYPPPDAAGGPGAGATSTNGLAVDGAG